MTRRLLWFVLAFLVSCASAPSETPSIPVGFTECVDGVGGVAWIRLDVLLEQKDWMAVGAHEYTHVLTVNRFPSCSEYYEWLDEGHNRRNSEAIAFCAMAYTEQRLRRREFRESLRYYAGYLADYYNFGLSVEQADSLIVSVCPPRDG